MKHLLLAALFAFAALPARADPILDEVSRYFNNLTTLEAGFKQYNPDGTVFSGVFYMKRPGQMRMDYDPGTQSALVLVNAGSIVVFDGPRDTVPGNYPLRATPLESIMVRNVDLSRNPDIIGTDIHDDHVSIFAHDSRHPERGVAKFTLSRAPMHLKSLTITDAGSETTHLVLDDNRRTGHRLSSRLFSLNQELRSRRKTTYDQRP